MLRLLHRLVDEPLAIVLGAIALVLIGIQLLALGALANEQVERAEARDAAQRAQQRATLQCLDHRSRNLHAQCLLQVADQRATGAAALVPASYTVP